MQFTSLEHITSFLQEQDQQRQDHYTLDRMHQALELLGRPDHQFTMVHIGGTSGKGSTSKLVASIARASGASVGLFTSPAIVSPLERIQVNGQPVSEAAFVQLVNTVWPKLSELQLTYFEFFTLFAAYHFADVGVECAVFEVGMGGRLDATNAMDSTVAIVTTVGLDHTAHLGDTLEAIAEEKEHIIKGDTIGLTGSTYVKRGRYIDVASAEITQADLHGTIFNYTSTSGAASCTYADVQLGIPGTYQVHNAVLAIEAAQELTISETAIRDGLHTVKNPARFEVVSEEPLLIVDGAHNPQKMEAFSAALCAAVQVNSAAQLTDEFDRVVLLTSMKNDKDIIGAYKHILPGVTQLIITSFGDKAYPLEQIQTAALQINPNLTIELQEDLPTAFKQFKAVLTPQSLGLVTGSLYMIGALREQSLL